MPRKAFLTIMLALHLLFSFASSFYIQSASAAKIWYVNDDGGADFIKIQDAINAASQGDIIYVYNGTYNEHLTVTQSLTITGENMQATIIDGSLTGTVIGIEANNVQISEFTIQNGYEGIKVLSYNGSIISNNNIAKNRYEGIVLEDCKNSTANSNLIGYNGWDGIYVANSSNVLLRRNTITTNNISGVKIEGSFDAILDYNTLSNNTWYGLSSWDSDHISVSQNTISLNRYAGVNVYNLTGSVFYQNNFINNTRQTRIDDLSANAWDNTVEGNYWSNYNGTDLYSGPDQTEAGSDGIGETHYAIDSNNQDTYPFMGPISFFDAGTWNGASYSINIASNSTLSDFNLDRIARNIAFNVKGEIGFGFCRVTLPNVVVQGLWRYGFKVLVDGIEPSWRERTDATHNYIYIAYAHSEHQIVIERLETEPPIITVLSPGNKTYRSKDVALVVVMSKPTSWIGYSLDAQGNVTIDGNRTITDLSEGSHSITVYANDTSGNMGYSDPAHFSVDSVAPLVEILSPKNTTYSASSVLLTVRVSEPTIWIGYSLDAQANQTLQATSKTISDLPDGMHSIIAYANDTAGNTGASETAYFTIDTQQPEPQTEPFPLWAVIAIATAVVAGTALLIYFVKFRKKP